jgi:hypothetical protein
MRAAPGYGGGFVYWKFHVPESGIRPLVLRIWVVLFDRVWCGTMMKSIGNLNESNLGDPVKPMFAYPEQ